MQSTGLHRNPSAGESAHILQSSGFLGLQTKPGSQPHVRLDFGSTPAALATVLVGAEQVVTEPRIVVPITTVVGGPGGSVTDTGGTVCVTPGGSVIVMVSTDIDPETTLTTVVPGSVSVVVTAGTTAVVVTTDVAPRNVVTDPGSVVTEPGRVITEPGRVTVTVVTVTVGPGTVVTEPDTVATDPGRVVVDAGSVVTEPGIVVTDPGSVTVVPETVTRQITTLVAVRVTGGGMIVLSLPLIVVVTGGGTLT